MLRLTFSFWFAQARSTTAAPSATRNFGCYFLDVLTHFFLDYWRHVLHLPFLSCTDSEFLGRHSWASCVPNACFLVAYQRQIWANSFVVDLSASNNQHN